MSDILIQAENLTKIYKLHKHNSFSLYNEIVNLFKKPFSKSDSPYHLSHLAFIKALDNISFQVKTGEVIGIIGRNGAGKSTLLKILARITQPTEGQAIVKGRIGALLSLGVGFHPELTGRENVYLNGVILGLKRKEIDKIFDDIISFAGYSEFIDTPVKYYSDGMRLRLGFSVAAFLKTEVLLIDEVLGVGDIYFQDKALKKVEEIKNEGRTAIFVSHLLNQIKRYCTRCIWLDSGSIKKDGNVLEVTASYEQSAYLRKKEDSQSKSSKNVEFLYWEIHQQDENNDNTGFNTLTSFGSVSIVFNVKSTAKFTDCNQVVGLYGSLGQLTWCTAQSGITIEEGINEIVYTMDSLPLKPGGYMWVTTLYDRDGNILDSHNFEVPLLVNTKSYVNVYDYMSGHLNLPFKFSVKPKNQ